MSDRNIIIYLLERRRVLYEPNIEKKKQFITRKVLCSYVHTISLQVPTSLSRQVNLQHNIDKLCQWSDKNKMVLIADKTKSILITGKRLKSRMQLSSLPLTASDSNIELVSSQKLLGVIIDEHLTFKEHINKLSKNLSKKSAC